MKEITDKLAHELLHELNQAENWCDERGNEAAEKHGHASKESTDWMTASQLIFLARAHLQHHMRDTIKHPDYEEAKR